MADYNGETAQCSGSLCDVPMGGSSQEVLPDPLTAQSLSMAKVGSSNIATVKSLDSSMSKSSDQLVAAPRPLAVENNEEVGQSLESPLSKPEGLHFSSFNEAKSRLAEPRWTPPSVGVPRTAEEDQKCIRRLVDAIKRTDKAMDADENAYRIRFKGDYYQDESIEYCAWNILVSPRRQP